MQSQGGGTTCHGSGPNRLVQYYLGLEGRHFQPQVDGLFQEHRLLIYGDTLSVENAIHGR